MRVFLGLTEVSGFYTNLKKGFDEIGVDAELVSLVDHRFDYGRGDNSCWIRIAKSALSVRKSIPNAYPPISFILNLWVGITRVFLFVWAVIRFDVFIFCCATSFFRFRELPLLKLLGKKIIYNFHGTDGRCGFMDGFAEDTFMPAGQKEGTGYIGPIRETDSSHLQDLKVTAYYEITKIRKKNLDYIDRYADVIINSPSHGQHHSRPFVQRLILGMPFMPPNNLNRVKKKSRPTRRETWILHSPSFPEGKGTPLIRNAIQSLKDKGHSINFLEIQNRPNHEVLELIQQCDFVVDQAYSDMAMVGFATEAAFFGKPAVVGGYYARHQARDINKRWIPPTHFCVPEAIEDGIEKLIIDKKGREELGERARSFVEKNWLASRSAERFIKLANGDYPKDWLFDPKNSDYILGMGLSKQNVRKIVNGIYKKYGINSFLIDDKPLMKGKLQNFLDKP